MKPSRNGVGCSDIKIRYVYYKLLKKMVTDNEVKGIIYKITNLVNDKIYIGKTKTHYGNKPFTIEQRLDNHFAQAKRMSPGRCPALANAIQKYGPENFVIEEMLRCDLEDVDEHEMELIKMYDSTNKKIGYNIALGGGGRSVVNVPEETRKKISSKKGKNMNLTKIFRNGIHVGYSARRRDKGKAYQKWFTSTKNTPEENKKLAEEWLNDFRNKGIIGETDYNKASELPKYICQIKENGVVVGYLARIFRKGKKYGKSFQSKTTPLPKLLQKAIKYRDELLNKMSEQSKN